MTQQKPRQHDINLISEKQLELFIAKIGWVENKLPRDYGEDYLVYIFDDNGSRIEGGVFLVQLKGTDEIDSYKLKQSNFFSIDIELRHLREWQSYPIPVILILWDIVLERGHWLYVQGFIDKQLKEQFDSVDETQKTLSIHIPVSQVSDFSNKADFIQNITAICKGGLSKDKLLENRRKYALSSDFQEVSQYIDLPKTVQQQQNLAMIETFIAMYPKDPHGWEAKASLFYEEIGDMEIALASINKALELDPTNKGYIWMRACALAEYAIFNGGSPKSMLQEALGIFTNFDGVDEETKNYNIGNSLAGLGRHPEAIEHYALALNANPPNELAAQIWKNRGTCLFHLGLYSEEFDCYKKSLALKPNHWQALVSWATTEMRLGNFPHAEELLTQAVEVNPIVTHYGYRQLYWLAYCQWKNSKPNEAYQTIQAVLSQSPALADARQLKAYILAEFWREDFEGYKDIAIEYFATLFLDEPQNPVVQLELFLIYEKLGEIEKARSVLDYSLNLDDVPAQALYHHAMQLKRDDKISEAITAMEKAFEKSQEHHIVHNLAHLKKATGEYREAIHFYQMAKDDCSTPRAVVEDIAHCHYFLREYKACAELMIFLLKDEPSDPAWWTNLGGALLQLGFSDILLDELARVHNAVMETVELGQPIDSLLKLEIARLFTMLEKVLAL